ncbi:SCO family protein [Psychrosphaera ytuae]|uniref:SCO family protein n=1 Tax=Psychrosphaera ytuae TaxID=2820710 RepID=A0A975DC42_9GAMM|nr:SCO family protein [Psychrosphaera ytuae]QTH62920.1 SCO family protein [Psychrosphaera ytuae]
MKKSQSIYVVIIALISFILGISLYKGGQDSVDPTTLVYKSPRGLKSFAMQSHTGSVFTNEQLQGKWSFLFLGYLSCPDICPMTMMKLSQILPELKQVADNSQVVFVSVDPKRDTVAKVAQYVDYFHPDIIGLRAEHKDLYPMVRDLGLMYSIPSNDIEDNYYVDHSGSIVLINPQGQIHAMFKPVVKAGEVPTIVPEIVVKDFKIIQQ